ncbi:MAG TPA: hypothetical protein VE173_16065, partial [Longimicrobiales bacterium]|nr:hypothetical protein [Longimicrobiales bacterium]
VAEAGLSVGAQAGEGVVRATGFGTARVTAAVGAARGDIDVTVTRPETESDGFTVLGSGLAGSYTSDLWVHGEYAYTGTGPWWSCGGPEDPCDAREGRLFVWRLLADGGLEKVDSLALPAPHVNDVKVSADGTFAVASQENGTAGEGGIVLIDLTNPAAPSIVSTFTEDLEGGVHNTWIERIDGRDYVFVVEDGGSAGGLHVVDVTDRTAPTSVARYYGGSSLVHDVYVRDGLAFVSHWNYGLVILDVGNGMTGGSPENPTEVGRVVTAGGHVHNAWYWPEGAKVFVGEEQFIRTDGTGSVGVMHVVDVSDMTAPVEVAHFGVPGTTPHNFWMDEDRGILYAAWYEQG